MSDEFIPLNQSTPTSGRWQNQGRHRNLNLHNVSHYNHNHSGTRRSFNNHNRWGNNSQRNNSFGSDSNNSSYGQDRCGIDAYLHPSMLQDPWAQLKRKMETPQ